MCNLTPVNCRLSNWCDGIFFWLFELRSSGIFFFAVNAFWDASFRVISHFGSFSFFFMILSFTSSTDCINDSFYFSHLSFLSYISGSLSSCSLGLHFFLTRFSCFFFSFLLSFHFILSRSLFPAFPTIPFHILTPSFSVFVLSFSLFLSVTLVLSV